MKPIPTRNPLANAFRLLSLLFITICTPTATAEKTSTPPDAIVAQMEKDYDDDPSYTIIRFQSEENIPKEYRRLKTKLAILTGEDPGRTSHRVHSIHENHTRPYAVIISKPRVRNSVPFVTSVPKGMFTAESWEAVKKAIPSKFPEKWGLTIPGPPPIELPFECVLTSADGRKIEGTIVNRIDESHAIIFLRKSDSKELVIPLGKISEQDRQWVLHTLQPAIRVLALITENSWRTKTEQFAFVHNNCDVVLLPRNEDKGRDLSKLADIKPNEFDIIWMHYSDDDEPIVMDLLKKFTGVVMVEDYRPEMTRYKFFRSKRGVATPASLPFIVTDENFVFYQNNVQGNENPHRMKPGQEAEAVTTAINLLKKYPTQK